MIAYFLSSTFTTTTSWTSATTATISANSRILGDIYRPSIKCCFVELPDGALRLAGVEVRDETAPLRPVPVVIHDDVGAVDVACLPHMILQVLPARPVIEVPHEDCPSAVGARGAPGKAGAFIAAAGTAPAVRTRSALPPSTTSSSSSSAPSSASLSASHHFPLIST